MNSRFVIPTILIVLAISLGQTRTAWAQFSIESTDFPIRVQYGEDGAEFAPDFLGWAENIWQVVIDAGLPQPQRLVDDQIEEGWEIVLDTGIAGASTYMVEGDNPDTATADCPTVSLINPFGMVTEDMITMVLHHNLVRQSLHAVDCIEPFKPAYDMFALAHGKLYMGTDHPYWPMWLSDFQNTPWNSVDYAATTPQGASYAYGSGLFALFVDEAYGAGDGTLLIDIWERTAQDGHITSWEGPYVTETDVDNEPDFLDAYEAELIELGTTFDDAFISFVEWRFFIGTDDDGVHFSNANQWVGGEVARDIVIDVGLLPLEDSPGQNNVAEYGASYIELNPADLNEGSSLVFEFSGNEATSWWVGLFLISDSEPTTVVPFEMTDAHAGEIELADPAQYDRIVMALANLGDGDHDADETDWSTANGDYIYSIYESDGPDDDDGGTDDQDASTQPAGGKSKSGCGCTTVGSKRWLGSLLDLVL